MIPPYTTAAILISISGLLSAEGNVVTSKIQIEIPKLLHKDGGYDHQGALFGIPPYGGSIVENVYYTDSKMCDASDDVSRGGWPERENGDDGEMLPWKTPFTLMIDDGGGCSYVTKVRNAQRAGAAAVVIADSLCLCENSNICHSSEENGNGGGCRENEIVMKDDGSGSDISIPSFIMLKHDADNIKQTLKVNVPVRMSLQWSLPNPGSRVKYDMWTDPTNSATEEFLLDFKEAALKLGDSAHFTPHMYLIDGKKSGCQDGNAVFCKNMCTNNGRYCARDPDHNQESGVSGAEMVEEILRRLCIWDNYGHDGVGIEWWSYVDNFLQDCGLKKFTDKPCIIDSMKRANIDVDMIEKCMEDSGELTHDVHNTRLELELDLKDQQGIVIIPTASVNDAVIRGGLDFRNMFQAVCAGYKDGTEPEICLCAKCHDERTCVDRGYCTAPPGTEGAVSKHTFIVTIICIVLVAIVISLVAFEMRMRRQMRDHVRGVITNYISVDKHETEFEIDPEDECSIKFNQN